MPKRDTKQAVLTALEPSQMQVPAMDRPSVALAWFMDNITITHDAGGSIMSCDLCGVVICDVTDDTLRVLFNTALAHGC